MSKTTTIIIIIAIVALAAWYFIRKGSGEEKKGPTNGPKKPGELEINEYTAETNVSISPANSVNSAISAAIIECELAQQYAHADWTMKWKGVSISGVTKGASYNWEPIRFTGSDNSVYDKLYDSSENGARFVITKSINSPGERIHLMIFDNSQLSVSNSNLVWLNSIAAKEFDIVSGTIYTLK